MTYRTLSFLLTACCCVASINSAPAAEKLFGDRFDSAGTKIYYRVQGAGTPVVLVHGWLSSAGGNWELPGISALLAKDFRVIEFDVRGHGLSDKPTTEEAYGTNLVDDVVRLMDHLEVKQAHIVGYSMGSIIAENFIVKHSDRVLSGTLGGMGWMKAGGAGQWGFAQIGKNDLNASALTLCGRSLSKLAISEDELKSIKVPMTVLVGEKDDLIKGLYVTPLKTARTDWPIIDIKDADHLTCIIKPQFKEELQKWLLKQNRK